MTAGRSAKLNPANPETKWSQKCSFFRSSDYQTVSAGTAVRFCSCVISCANPRDSAPLSPRVALGIGVDTSSSGPWGFASATVVREIVIAWQQYLAEQAAHRLGPMVRSQCWSDEQQRRWPYYDFAPTRNLADFDAIIVDARPLRSASADTFLVRTLFIEPSRDNSPPRPSALVTVHARRIENTWRFESPIDRVSADWKRFTVGFIHYVVQPGPEFDAARAQLAVAFADSLAEAFEVPRVDSMTTWRLILMRLTCCAAFSGR